MDSASYQCWWPLHLRFARGESLSAEEEKFYRAGLSSLEAGEIHSEQEEALKRLEVEIQGAASENRLLQQRRAELEKEMRALQLLLKDKQPA